MKIKILSGVCLFISITAGAQSSYVSHVEQPSFFEKTQKLIDTFEEFGSENKSVTFKALIYRSDEHGESWSVFEAFNDSSRRISTRSLKSTESKKKSKTETKMERGNPEEVARLKKLKGFYSQGLPNGNDKSITRMIAFYQGEEPVFGFLAHGRANFMVTQTRLDPDQRQHLMWFIRKYMKRM